MRLSERFVLRPLAHHGAARRARRRRARRCPPAFMVADRRVGRRAVAHSRRGISVPALRAVLRAAADLRRPSGPASCIAPSSSCRTAAPSSSIAVAEEGAWSPGLPPPRRLALIGWRREEAGGIARDWPALPARPIGVTCRLCERHRLRPPRAPAGDAPGRLPRARRRPVRCSIAMHILLPSQPWILFFLRSHRLMRLAAGHSSKATLEFPAAARIRSSSRHKIFLIHYFLIY